MRQKGLVMQDGGQTSRDGALAAAAQAARRRPPLVMGLRLLIKAGLPVAVLFGAWQGFAYMKATKPEPPRRPAEEQTFAIDTRPVAFSRYQPELALFGETVSGRTVEIRALVAGEVTEVGSGLKEGGVVDAGETLVTIDAFNYEGAVVEAKAQLQEATGRLEEFKASLRQEEDALKHDREQLTLAERDLERAEPLAKRGTVTRKTVDDRQVVVNQRMQAVEQRANNLNIWAAKINQQEAAITRLNWGVRQAERRLQETRLKAPFAAYVSDVGAEVGRVLSGNDRVAVLRDRGAIEVRVTLSDNQYGRILSDAGSLIGRKVQVIWRVGDEPIVYAARIARIAATISTASGGVTLFATIEDPEMPTPLRPGAFVEVSLPDRAYDRVARLPQTAIYGGGTVYVHVDGRIQPREVQVIGRADRDALVRGEIAEGDLVMTTRLSAPGPGVKVKLRPDPALASDAGRS